MYPEHPRRVFSKAGWSVCDEGLTVWVLVSGLACWSGTAEAQSCEALRRSYKSASDSWNELAKYDGEERTKRAAVNRAIENAQGEKNSVARKTSLNKRIIDLSRPYLLHLNTMSSLNAHAQGVFASLTSAGQDRFEACGGDWSDLRQRKSYLKEQEKVLRKYYDWASGIQNLATKVVAIGNQRTVSDQVVLPRTVEQGRGAPPCGNPFGVTTADRVVDQIGSALDRALGNVAGIPVASTVLRSPVARDWIKSRLGINNGKSACKTLCVAYRGRKLKTSITAWDETGKSELSVAGKEFGIGWARLDSVTHAVHGKTRVTCAAVRHWRHDRARGFRLDVDYQL